MSRLNSTPPIIQQMIENLNNKQNHDNVRFNTLISLENIRDCINLSIENYNKTIVIIIPSQK